MRWIYERPVNFAAVTFSVLLKNLLIEKVPPHDAPSALDKSICKSWRESSGFCCTCCISASICVEGCEGICGWIEIGLNEKRQCTLFRFQRLIVVAHQHFRRLPAVLCYKLIVFWGQANLVHLSRLSQSLELNLIFNIMTEGHLRVI